MAMATVMHTIIRIKPITRIELYKDVDGDGDFKLVDCGIESQVPLYIKQGYTVIRCYNQERRIS